MQSNWKNSFIRIVLCIVLIGSAPVLLSKEAASQPYPPAIGLHSFMNYMIYDSGLMRIDFTDVAFAPPGPANARVIIRNADGSEAAAWPFYENYKARHAVFGRMAPNNQAIFTFTEGSYALDYEVAGKLATRIPFSVETKSVSDDPFNPGKKLKFTGPWQQWAYLAPVSQNDATSAAAVHFWGGVSDFKGVKRSPATYAKVLRNGALIAHSNRRTGDIWNRPMQRARYVLQVPHETTKSHLAKGVTMADLTVDGNYRITIETVDDAQVIREFAFSTSGGVINPHPRTVLGYQPSSEFIPPRAPNFGGSTYEMIDAVWISTPE
ncbi:MAG: hypothetical protein AAF850_00280 [Pseudomonadota bacterium]